MLCVFAMPVSAAEQAIPNSSFTWEPTDNNTRLSFDIIHLDVEMPFCAMCINVDDFDQALTVFIEDGYRQMGEPVFVNNAIKVLIKKSENIPILLIQHLK